jgi:hypothetical protein
MRGGFALGLAAALVTPPLWAQEASPTSATRSGLVVIPRVDVLLFGGVSEDLDCSASGTAFCRPSDDVTYDYDDTSQVALGVDVLGNLTEYLRVGTGLWFVPEARVENDAGYEAMWGRDLSFVVISEGVLDVMEDFAFVGRLFAGGFAFFPAGYGADAIDDAQDSCDALRAGGAKCEVSGGPYVGPTLGGGVGTMGALGPLAWRGDLVAQWYTLPMLAVETSNERGALDLSSHATGKRLWLSVGMEL